MCVPCTGVLPDALESACSKCNEKQKSATEKVFQHLSKNKPAQWAELTAKYDPQSKYRTKYETLAQEKGVKVWDPSLTFGHEQPTDYDQETARTPIIWLLQFN